MNENIEKIVLKETPESFSHKVEELVWMQDISYFDAINNIMSEMNYEPESVAKLLTVTVKARLQKELEDLNLLEKTEVRSIF